MFQEMIERGGNDGIQSRQDLDGCGVTYGLDENGRIFLRSSDERTAGLLERRLGMGGPIDPTHGGHSCLGPWALGC